MPTIQNRNIILRRYKDKFIYAGESEVKLMHGKGILVFPFNKTYIGAFAKGEFPGKGVLIFRESKYKHSVRFEAIWNN